MPRRRTYDYNRFSGGSGAANLLATIKDLREAPQREEDRQHEVRQRIIKGALDMLSLGAGKMQVARELGRAGIILPERDVTTRALVHPLGAGEDPEAAAFIPRTETTRREVDLGVLESPRDTFTRNLQQTEESAARGERRRFALGEQQAEAGVTREDVRREQFPTVDEQVAGIFAKTKRGERLTPADEQLLTDIQGFRSQKPGFRQQFENRIFELLAQPGGRANLNAQQGTYYDTNIRGRDPEALRRDEAREEERLRLERERLGLAREGQEVTRGALAETRADAQRGRVFTGLDNERARVAAKHERRRANVLPGRTEQDQLATIDSEEAFELAQLVGRWKKRHPKYAPDIEEQYGTDVGPRPGPRGRGFLDSFGDPTQPPRGPR